MNNGRGVFIVVEGIDGSGKSTQIKMLTSRLSEHGRRVFVTEEPTEGEVGRLIRRALAGEMPVGQSELAALFLADRIKHNTDPETGIKKLLADGVDVVCGRYYYSSFAYQGIESDLDWLISANKACPDVARPDLCIFLDVAPECGMSRVESRGERMEIFEKTSVQTAVREKYLQVIKALGTDENIRIIDAGKGVAAISDEIFAEAERLISAKRGT